MSCRMSHVEIEKLWKIERFSRKKRIDCLQAQGRALNKADIVVSRILDAAQERYIRKLKVSCRGGRGEGRSASDCQVGRKICLTVSRVITISLFRVLLRAGSVFVVDGNIRWLRIIHHVIISPGELDWGHNEVDGNVQTYTHTNVTIVCARRETNRLFVDRRMTNCFGIRFLRELCSRVLPLFPPNKRGSNPPPEAISSPVYFHLHPT